MPPTGESDHIAMSDDEITVHNTVESDAARVAMIQELDAVPIEELEALADEWEEYANSEHLNAQADEWWSHRWEENPSEQNVEKALDDMDFRDWFIEEITLCPECHKVVVEVINDYE